MSSAGETVLAPDCLTAVSHHQAGTAQAHSAPALWVEGEGGAGGLRPAGDLAVRHGAGGDEPDDDLRTKLTRSPHHSLAAVSDWSPHLVHQPGRPGTLTVRLSSLDCRQQAGH